MRAVGALAVVALACGQARPYPAATLNISIAGPGTVAVSGGAELRCLGACELRAPIGTEVTLTAAARTGANFAGFSGACTGLDACTLRLDKDVSVSASAHFEWVSLPPIQRYSWKRIDSGLMYFLHIDGGGSATGMRGGSPSEFQPIRYDAASGSIHPVPGLERGEVLSANDDGMILAYVHGVGHVRYHGGIVTPLDPNDGTHVFFTDLSEHGWAVGGAPGEQPWVDDGTGGAIWGDGILGSHGPSVPGVIRATHALAVNAQGRVVGHRSIVQRLANGTYAVPYSIEIRPDSVVQLPIDVPSRPTDLSDTGLAVGYVTTNDLWAFGYTCDLDTGAVRIFEPEGDDIAVLFTHVNPSGTVVGGVRLRADRTEEPILYFVNEDRLIALESLVGLPSHAELTQIRGINAFGQVLVGAWFRNDTDSSHGYLLLTPE